MRFSVIPTCLVGLLILPGSAFGADFDADRDGDVDLDDAVAFIGCFEGPGALVDEHCAIHHDSDADLDVDLFDFDGFQRAFTGPGIAIVERLTFTGSAFEAVRRDCPSGSCSAYGTPHWLDANLDGDVDDTGDHDYPVTYERGRNVSVTNLVFAVDPHLDLEDVPVRGTGPEGLVFTGTGDASGGSLEVSGTLQSDIALPDMVAFYESFTIRWEIALDGETFQPAGATHTRMYVTWDAPTGEKLESYFDISTRAAHGMSDQEDAIEAIWSEFTDLDVVNVRGEPLAYYRGVLCASYCTYYSASELVYYTTSQCGGWADLLMECFQCQGIGGSEWVTIEPRGTPYLPLDCGYSPQPAPGFLVNNYTFQPGAPGPCSAYPFSFNDPCGYYGSWSEPQVLDADGLPGQDNPNPASWFARHFIVKINSRYYDPAYGAGPFTGSTAEACFTWEVGAVAGYFGVAQASGSRLGVRRDVSQTRECYFDR